jgi:hypothetical protein
LATVAAFLLVEAARILVRRPHVVMYGDQALLELGARRAMHLDQLVGPYSRSGFHHPGPAVFYLLAPFVRFLEPRGPGLYLGAVILNAAALVTAVAVIWRRVGALAALWAAAVIDVFCLFLGVGTLREPWNPYLVIAPMVLFAVLWAAGWTGSTDAAVWAFVIGSYVLQTEVATAAVIVLLCIALAIRIARRARKRDRLTTRPRWGPSRVIGCVVLVAMWVPTAVEPFRLHPSNLSLLWDFFTSGHAEPQLGRALGIADDAVSVVPFGNHDYVLALHRGPIAVATSLVLLAAGLILVLLLSRANRSPMSCALAASGVTGALVGTISLTRSDGPVYLYFALWLAYVPVTVMLAVGVGLLGRDVTGVPTEETLRPLGRPTQAGRLPRAAVPLCVAAAIIVSGLSVGADLNMGGVTTTTGSGPWPAGNAATAEGRHRTVEDTLAMSHAAEKVLHPADRWVGFNIGSTSVWPYVAGMVLELDQRGIQSTVAPAQWTLYFGDERSSGRPVNVLFSVYPAGGPSPPDGSTVTAVIDGTSIAYHRFGG